MRLQDSSKKRELYLLVNSPQTFNVLKGAISGDVHKDFFNFKEENSITWQVPLML